MLALLQASQAADLKGREIGSLAEAEIPEGVVRERPALQVDIQGQKAKKVENPHQGFYLDQSGNPEQCRYFSGSLKENREGLC
ncbi:MAG: hypothetical protein U0931_36105 [Vulcanimicrobiota bacterium]